MTKKHTGCLFYTSPAVQTLFYISKGSSVYARKAKLFMLDIAFLFFSLTTGNNTAIEGKRWDTVFVLTQQAKIKPLLVYFNSLLGSSLCIKADLCMYACMYMTVCVCVCVCMLIIIVIHLWREIFSERLD